MKLSLLSVLVLAACSSSPSRVAVPVSTTSTQDPWQAEPDVSGLDPTESQNDPEPENQPAVPSRPTPSRSSDDPSGIVAAHNVRRARHCAAPLRWSAEVAVVAQRWANGLAARGCVMQHSSGKYGENLAMIMGGTLSAEQVAAMWYDEVALYDFAKPGFSMQAGHFTQVVWRGTSAVGCGKASCGNGEIWVCNYDGPGNWEGAFPANVVPAGSNCATLPRL
jgi:pathogenesis-related protein 1